MRLVPLFFTFCVVLLVSGIVFMLNVAIWTDFNLDREIARRKARFERLRQTYKKSDDI